MNETVKFFMVDAFCAQAKVMVRRVDAETFSQQHVYNVEIIALGSQHDWSNIWGEVWIVLILKQQKEIRIIEFVQFKKDIK